MGIFLLAVSLVLGGALSAWQAGALAGRGSDHLAHLFLVRAIRGNNYRLLTQVPGLVNPSYCGAYPLFLHWLLAWLPDTALPLVARWLSAGLLMLQTLALYLILQWLGQTDLVAGGAALLFALTPQFYHAYSARNYGLSSRIIGLFLFMLLGFWDTGLAASIPTDAWTWGIGIMLGYLVWGFNTFSQQMVVLIGLVLLCLGRWKLLAAGMGGLVVLLALHPKYATSYLIHTGRFVHSYATEVAAVFIIRRRPSIWRDLVCDIWQGIRKSVIKGLSYAYANSVLIVLLLSPLVPASVLLWLDRSAPQPPLTDSVGELCLAGLLVFVMTSFRQTRFLGEPERYVEAVAPFASAYIAIWVSRSNEMWALWLVLAYSLAVILLQLWAINMHQAATDPVLGQVREVERAITELRVAAPISLCCNNEEITKLLMANPWQFFRLWAGGQRYAGMSFAEACDSFPFLKADSFRRIVECYRISVVVLDHTNFREMPQIQGVKAARVFQTERFTVICLDWSTHLHDDMAVR